MGNIIVKKVKGKTWNRTAHWWRKKCRFRKLVKIIIYGTVKLMPKSTRLGDLTVRELRWIASKRRIKLRSQARKAEIVIIMRSAIPAEQLRRDMRKSLKNTKKMQGK